MAIRRLNYTGRKRIAESDAPITIYEPDEGPSLAPRTQRGKCRPTFRSPFSPSNGSPSNPLTFFARLLILRSASRGPNGIAYVPR